MHVIRMLNN